jgi:hypothetical protein
MTNLKLSKEEIYEKCKDTMPENILKSFLNDHYDDIEISNEEECYRRGFHHGFVVAKNKNEVTESDVRSFRYNRKDEFPTPPGM